MYPSLDVVEALLSFHDIHVLTHITIISTSLDRGWSRPTGSTRWPICGLDSAGYKFSGLSWWEGLTGTKSCYSTHPFRLVHMQERISGPSVVDSTLHERAGLGSPAGDCHRTWTPYRAYTAGGCGAAFCIEFTGPPPGRSFRARPGVWVLYHLLRRRLTSWACCVLCRKEPCAVYRCT